MPDLPTAFTEAIRDRYVVEREIGAGGMATVHLARDVRHNRNVAIKVLKPELAASLGAERFLKEIEIAARLTHPHIIPLHDSGEAAGSLYYVMPFIDGESLRARLRRERHIEPAVALDIVRRVGDALSYAHRQGILHRDIKPENILFADGHPMVADFGIARAVSTAGGAGLTRTGLALGTPGYMSPEQAAGEHDLDARTDVYSLGCVLYEMLVGEPPGMWQVDGESLELGRFADPPERHRPRLHELDRPTEGALVRALAMRARDRFESVDAFVHALCAEEETAGAGEGAVRRYSEDEVEEIVRQAAEDQRVRPTGEGMSLETIQQIAAEVGLSPERIERAVRDLEIRERVAAPARVETGAFWLGSSTVIATERLVDGDASESVYDDLVDEVQATLSTEGQVETRPRSLTWRTAKPVLGKRRAVQVRITSRAGRTHINIQERLGELAVSLFPSITVGGGLGGLAVILSLGGPEFGWLAAGLFGAGWVSGMHALARAIFRGIARQKRTDLEGLGSRLAVIATEPDRAGVEAPSPKRPLPGWSPEAEGPRQPSGAPSAPPRLPRGTPRDEGPGSPPG